MGWQVELLRALVEMVKTGGMYAIWGIVAWWVFTILKLGVVLCFLTFFVRTISGLVSKAINNNYLLKQCKQDTDRLSTLNSLVTSFRECQDTTAGAMRDFLREAEDLLKKLKEQKTE